MLWLGTTLRQNAGAFRIMGSALAGSIVFFLVSNFAVWAAWRDLYPMTFAGLITCYAAGLPFFRRAIEGDLFFTAAMFATPVILHSLAGRSKNQTIISPPLRNFYVGTAALGCPSSAAR